MEILRYKPLENHGALKANFALKIPRMGLIINDMKYFESGGKRWISFPQKQTDVEGQKKYFPYMQFIDKSVMAQFTEQVLQLVDQYKLANGL